jgi:SecD/SecF fusion protein
MWRTRVLAVCLLAIALGIGGPWGTKPASAQSTSGIGGCLSFHEVHPQITAQEALRTQAPHGFRVYPAADARGEALLLRENPVVRASEVANVEASINYRGSPTIAFQFDAEGTHKFAAFTRQNIGRPFAIVIDGRVVSAPVILEPILGGRGEISGNLTIAETERLAGKLQSGTCL